MALSLKMFEGKTIIDIQNAVNEWINIKESDGLNIKREQIGVAFDSLHQQPLIIMSVWYETVIKKEENHGNR